MRRSLTIRPIARQGRLEETRYTKRDDGKPYRHEGDSDLWLIETRDGQRGTLALPRAGAGWTRDGDTYWLTNPPMSKRARSARRSRSTARRKAKKRPPPRGFKSWSTYMASIRPNPKRARKSASSGGSTVATRKKRRRRYTRASARRRRNPPAATNRPRRRSGRRRRRNPPVFSVGGVIGGVMDAGKGAAAMLAGEGGTRFVRKDLLGMDDGETLSSVADFGIGTVAGLLVQRFLGRQVGRDLTAGVYAYVGRTIARQLGIDKLNEVLGDGGAPMHRFELRNGRLVRVPLASYPNNGRLGSYVRPMAGVDQEDELFGA